VEHFEDHIALGTACGHDFGNTANYDSPTVTNLAAQGVSTADPKRLDIYMRLLKQVQTDAPYVVLFDLNQYAVLSKKYAWPGYGPFPWIYGPAVLYIKPA
jgi:hypothetical protein